MVHYTLADWSEVMAETLIFLNSISGAWWVSHTSPSGMSSCFGDGAISPCIGREIQVYEKSMFNL